METYHSKVFRGPVMQRGYGLGGFFKGLARSFAPVLKKGLMKVGKRVIQTGIQTMQDVAEGKSFKTALIDRGKENTKGLIGDVVGTSNIKKAPSKKSISRKRAAKGSTSTKSKRRKTDIFD